MAEDEKEPAAAAAAHAVVPAPSEKAIVLLKDTPFEFGDQLGGKVMRLPSEAADKLIASGAARAASALDIAIGAI